MGDMRLQEEQVLQEECKQGGPTKTGNYCVPSFLARFSTGTPRTTTQLSGPTHTCYLTCGPNAPSPPNQQGWSQEGHAAVQLKKDLLLPRTYGWPATALVDSPL